MTQLTDVFAVKRQELSLRSGHLGGHTGLIGVSATHP